MVVKKLGARQLADEIIAPAYTHRMEVGEMPKFRIPEHGAMPEVAERLISDELMLDGNARLNLATFVTTWMEPQAERLMAGSFDKNMIDNLVILETHDRIRGMLFRSLESRISAINMLGSIAFGISAIGAFVVPSTGELLSLPLVNIFTFIGAILFFMGAALLIPAMEPEPTVEAQTTT